MSGSTASSGDTDLLDQFNSPGLLVCSSSAVTQLTCKPCPPCVAAFDMVTQRLANGLLEEFGSFAKVPECNTSRTPCVTSLSTNRAHTSAPQYAQHGMELLTTTQPPFEACRTTSPLLASSGGLW